MKTSTSKTVFKFCFGLLFLGFYFSALSQTNPKVKKTFRADFEVPQILLNRALDTLFRGVYNVNLSMNFGIKNVTAGIYAGMMQSQIFPHFYSDPHSIQTVYSSGLRLGYDVYPSAEKMQTTKGNFFMFSPFLGIGYASVNYSRLKCITGKPEGTQDQTFSISAGANFNLMFSQYDGVGFTIGYSFLNHVFNPDPLCLSQYYPNIREKDKQGLSHYLIFGLNWYLDLAKRDKDYE
jgi:hypothetical protein